MTNWTEEQFNAVLGRALKRADERAETAQLARGRMPVTKMNKLEAAYDAHLAARQIAGEILWRRFEPLKLRLADGSFYTPDFGVLTSERLFELHETKGFWREAARVRIKIASELFPFKFIAVKKTETGWEREDFS